MRIGIKITFLGIFLNLATSVLAVPSPLGCELGKAKIQDVKKKYNLTKVHEHYPCSDQNIYEFKSSSLPDLNGFKYGVFSFDNNDVLQAVMLFVDKNEFDVLFESLSEKYKLSHHKKEQSGEKAIFVDGSFTIGLFPDSTSRDLIFILYTSESGNKINQRCNNKMKERKNKVKKLL